MAKRRTRKRVATKKPAAAQRKPKSAKLIALRRKAEREGWAKWIRKGPGQEADERAMLNGCRFDQSRADHVCEFFDRYAVLTEGEWKGKNLELMDWQRDWLSHAFGWVVWDSVRGQWIRRYKYFYLEVPNKNGKTPLLANVGNYLLFGDSWGRQINMFLAATSRKQAQRCMVHATRVYKYRQALRELAVTKKLEGFLCVEYGDNLWECLAANVESSDGINGHILADELHLWIGHAFFNGLRWALASQPEGVFCAITTAGKDPESVCRSLHDKTIEVNSGRQFDQQFYGLIYGADRDDDPHDEKTWFKANPSLGTNRKSPLKLSSFRADYETAKLDPTQWTEWLQKRLNVWQSAQESWLPLDKWDAGEVARSSAKGRRKRQPRIDCFEKFSIEHAPGRVPWNELEGIMAFDGATTRDTTSAVFTFEHPKEDGVLLSLPFFWLPENRARQLGDKVPFREWSEQGFITLTPGDAVDFDTIFADLERLVNHFGIEEFFFDPNFQAEWLTQKLEEKTGAQRLEFPQTMMHYSPAMKTAERMIYERTWRHNGHPVMTWQMGNLKSKSDVNNNIRPVKQKHGDYRTVDGPVAGIMTIRNWLGEDEGSYYDDNEMEMG